MPPKISKIQKIRVWITCALILFGALVACSAAPTPVAIATSTLIPSTATNTATPLTPSATIIVTASPTVSPTRPPDNLIAIIESSVTPNPDLMTQIFNALASELSVPTNRIQLVSVDEQMWSRRTLGCDTPVNVPISVIADSPDREVAGFRFVLLLGNSLYEYHTEGVERFVRCPQVEQAKDELLVTIDPVAADFLRVVQKQVAEQLDLSTRRVQLVTMTAITWPDNSLGCPQPEQDYTPVNIEGYRIVVTAGDKEYIFHTDSISVFPCPAEQEVLPEGN